MDSSENSNSIICALGFLVLALGSFSCFSKEEINIEKVLGNYKELKTYCDSGISIGPYGKREKFERCFRNDGFYLKAVYNEKEWPFTVIKWSDYERVYIVRGNTDQGVLNIHSYREHKNPEKQKIGEHIDPVLILDIFDNQILTGQSPELAVIRKRFTLNSDLSNSEISVFDFQTSRDSSKRKRVIRIWVRNSDLFITRFENIVDSEQVNFVEMSEIRVNLKLTSDDLSFDPPIFEKYTLNRRPDIVVPGFMSVAFVFGFIFWLVKFFGSIDSETKSIPFTFKLKMWKAFFVFLLVVVGITLTLDVITSNMTGGHPHPGIIAYGFGVLGGLGVLLYGAFLSSSHVAHWIAKTLVEKRKSR